MGRKCHLLLSRNSGENPGNSDANSEWADNQDGGLGVKRWPLTCRVQLDAHRFTVKEARRRLN